MWSVVASKALFAASLLFGTPSQGSGELPDGSAREGFFDVGGGFATQSPSVRMELNGGYSWAVRRSSGLAWSAGGVVEYARTMGQGRGETAVVGSNQELVLGNNFVRPSAKLRLGYANRLAWAYGILDPGYVLRTVPDPCVDTCRSFTTSHGANIGVGFGTLFFSAGRLIIGGEVRLDRTWFASNADYPAQWTNSVAVQLTFMIGRHGGAAKRMRGDGEPPDGLAHRGG